MGEKSCLTLDYRLTCVLSANRTRRTRVALTLIESSQKQTKEEEEEERCNSLLLTNCSLYNIFVYLLFYENLKMEPICVAGSGSRYAKAKPRQKHFFFWTNCSIFRSSVLIKPKEAHSLS